MNGKLVRAKSVLWRSHCRIHRYVAAPSAGRRGKDDRKQKYIGPVGAHPLSHINRFIVTPKNSLPPFHCRSADYSQPHFDSFGTFMRRLAFALNSIYLPLWRLLTHLPFSSDSFAIWKIIINNSLTVPRYWFPPLFISWHCPFKERAVIQACSG